MFELVTVGSHRPWSLVGIGNPSFLPAARRSRRWFTHCVGLPMLDGEHLAERCVVVALAITADGTKKPVGLWDGSTENKTVVRVLPTSSRAAWPSTTGAGRLRRRQGAVGRRVRGVRRQGPHPALHPAYADIRIMPTPVVRPLVVAVDGSGKSA
jgi:hypothetical protein